MTKEEYDSILDGNFVLFRFRYNELSFSNHVEIVDSWDDKWPVQRQYNIDGIKTALSLIDEDLEIVELGCHDGSLACELLQENDRIKCWYGYDICSKAISRSKNLEKYKPAVLNDWFHNLELPKLNLFISSHTLEHLSDDRVLATFDKVLDVKYLLLDTPLEEYGQDWAGYHASHVLKSGKYDLERWLQERDYRKLLDITENMAIWIKKERK